ncbi:MAG: hypothetical protein ACM3ML_30195 [Micromonosporaceae bacterium]
MRLGGDQSGFGAEVIVVAGKLTSPVAGANHDARRLKIWAVALAALTPVFFIGAVVLGEAGLPPLTVWAKVFFGVAAPPLVVAFHLSWVAWWRERKVAGLLPGSVALLLLLAMAGLASGSGYVWIFTTNVVALGGVLWAGRTALNHAHSRPHARPAAATEPGTRAEAKSSPQPTGLAAASRMYFLPHSRVGWWALALLVIAGLFPLYWNFLADTLPDVALVVLAFVAALTPLVLAYVAILRRKDRSVLLIVIVGGTCGDVEDRARPRFPARRLG